MTVSFFLPKRSVFFIFASLLIFYSSSLFAQETSTTTSSASPEQIAKGQGLFDGKIRFSKGGPSCIACHNVTNDNLMGGGSLAKDLTTVFSRMKAAGTKAIITRPPFPVMKEAYKDKALTEDEVQALVVFFEYADQVHAEQKTKDPKKGLLAGGVLGTILLLGLYSFVCLRRRKKMVNEDIYKRQLKSR